MKSRGRLHVRRCLAAAALAAVAAPAALFAQGAAAGPPKIEDLAKTVADNAAALNMVWVLVAGFLVMFMQLGFAMVETGFTRAKNAGHTATMNFMVYAIGMLAYWVLGFALQAGGVGALGTLGGYDQLNGMFSITLGGHEWVLFCTKGFFLTGVAYNASVFAFFLFQMVFMDTTLTIPTGALAERWKFSSFCVFTVFLGAIIYPIFGNWAWGGGWLSALGRNVGLGNGYVDFAGSGVVHLTGGVIALVTCKLLGPRRGKFNPDGSANVIPGHNIPMAMYGTFVLAFGWFGFNAGSTLAGTDSRIAIVATNTMLAGAAGAISAMIWVWMKYGKPDPSMLANGMLAGLVAITAPCAFVTAPSAVVIGLIAGVLVCWAVVFFERTLKLDDPVGAISVHGANGLWGVLAVGIFADGTYGAGLNGVAGNVTGLLYGGTSQIIAQLVGVSANVVWVGATAYAAWQITSLVTSGSRVSQQVEELGLDLPEMGSLAYPDRGDMTTGVVLSYSDAPSASHLSNVSGD
ncbi:MAG: Ammonium transporter [Gemmatimonadetes bacterium]|nr:Ammonium transporter [Gemmatimonadota bacterium]